MFGRCLLFVARACDAVLEWQSCWRCSHVGIQGRQSEMVDFPNLTNVYNSQILPFRCLQEEVDKCVGTTFYKRVESCPLVDPEVQSARQAQSWYVGTPGGWLQWLGLANIDDILDSSQAANRVNIFF